MTQEEKKPLKNAVEGLWEDYHKSLKENILLKDEIERCKEIAEQDGKEYAELLKDFRAMKAKLEKAKEALRLYEKTSVGEGYGNLKFPAMDALKEIEGE